MIRKSKGKRYEMKKKNNNFSFSKISFGKKVENHRVFLECFSIFCCCVVNSDWIGKMKIDVDE